MLLPSHERRLQRPERGRKASERVFSGLFSEEGKRSIIPGFEIRREEEEEKEARTGGKGKAMGEGGEKSMEMVPKGFLLLPWNAWNVEHGFREHFPF